ncbi:MAG: hypothetical protein WBF08_01340 [Candidatus Bathyarchaeia archaeon]
MQNFKSVVGAATGLEPRFFLVFMILAVNSLCFLAAVPKTKRALGLKYGKYPIRPAN